MGNIVNKIGPHEALRRIDSANEQHASGLLTLWEWLAEMRAIADSLRDPLPSELDMMTGLRYS